MKIAKLVRRNVRPSFVHDCECCRFLGQLDGEDLYFCRSGEFIIRRGSEGPEYRALPAGVFPPGTAYAFAAALVSRKLPPNAYRSARPEEKEHARDHGLRH